MLDTRSLVVGVFIGLVLMAVFAQYVSKNKPL